MALVPVARPESEAHIALIASAFEAADIPFHVQGAGLGSLFPGLQIASYTQRTVRVPQPCAADAVAVIAELGLHEPAPEAETTPRARDKWRNVLEFLLLGWIVPGVRRKRSAARDDAEES